MIDLKAVAAAELEKARLARLGVDAASADIEELIEDIHRAAYRQQVQVHGRPLWTSPVLKLAS
jgi:hypothetical protein